MGLSVEERAAALVARIEADHGPGTPVFAALVCDRCGLTIIAPTARKLAELTEGWGLGAAGPNDLCPGCTAGQAPPPAELVYWHAEWLDPEGRWRPFFDHPSRHVIESCPAHVRLNIGNVPVRLRPRLALAPCGCRKGGTHACGLPGNVPDPILRNLKSPDLPAAGGTVVDGSTRARGDSL